MSLTVLQLIDEVEAQRWRGELEALVAEFRAAASRLIEQFREHVEPAYERGESYPVELDVDGQTWKLHIHGEHCRFDSLSDDIVIEAHIDRAICAAGRSSTPFPSAAISGPTASAAEARAVGPPVSIWHAMPAGTKSSG